MDWDNERYVRVYTRDTPELLIMPWEARLLLWEFFRKADRAGVIDCGRHEPAKCIAALCHVPPDVAQRGLDAWLADGIVEVHEHDGKRFVVAPSFMAAQEAKQSDKARAKASRERRRDAARLAAVTGQVAAFDGDEGGPGPNALVTTRTTSSQNVTEPFVANESITRGHTKSLLPVPCLPVPARAGVARGREEPPPPSPRSTLDPRARAIAEVLDGHPGFVEAVDGRVDHAAEAAIASLAALDPRAKPEDFAAAARKALGELPPNPTATEARRKLRKFVERAEPGEALRPAPRRKGHQGTTGSTYVPGSHAAEVIR